MKLLTWIWWWLCSFGFALRRTWQTTHRPRVSGRRQAPWSNFNIIRYAGVTPFVVHVSNFSQLSSHNKTCVALANLQWNHQQKSDWKSNLPLFSYGYQKCIFVDSSFEYKGFSNCVHFECEVVNKSWRLCPIYVKHVSLCFLFFDLHSAKHQSNISVRLRIMTKNTRIP